MNEVRTAMQWMEAFHSNVYKPYGKIHSTIECSFCLSGATGGSDALSQCSAPIPIHLNSHIEAA